MIRKNNTIEKLFDIDFGYYCVPFNQIKLCLPIKVHKEFASKAEEKIYYTIRDLGNKFIDMAKNYYRIYR